MASRWERWCDIFAVPAPVDSTIWWEKKLSAPFSGATGDDDRITGALDLFDAVLGLAAAPAATPDTTGPDALHATTPDQDPADLALLTGPWEQVLLPTPVTEDTVYGHPPPRAGCSPPGRGCPHPPERDPHHTHQHRRPTLEDRPP